MSPVIQQVLGYSAEELIGKYVYTLVPSEERHVLGEKLKEAQEGKISPNDFRMVDKTGTIHWGRIIAQPLIEGEKITGITGLIGDITDLKHSEAGIAGERGETQTGNRGLRCGPVGLEGADR